MHMHLRLALTSVAIAALAACGGDDAPTATLSPTPAPTTTPTPDPAPAPAPVPKTNVSISVVDGAIQNAVVCLDANNNSVCDAGELQGTTDAAGKVTLAVPDTDMGKSPIIAMVGTDAVDADTGPVTVAYVMKAPADKPNVVSPLTTQVQMLIEMLNVSTAEATQVVRSQTNLLVSPLDDFTKTAATDPNAAVAARLARVLTAVTQKQMVALASVVGKYDSAGSLITQADLGAVVRSKLYVLLSAASSAAATDSDLVAPCAASMASAACRTAVDNGGTDGLARSLLTVATAPQFIGTQKLFAHAATATGPAPASVAGFSLDFVQAGDANNWYYRALVTSAGGALPDANGTVRLTDERKRNVNGTVTAFSYIPDPLRQGDLHWNGTAWVSCSVGQTFASTVRDAKGYATSSLCDGQNLSVGQRFSSDISGQKMADVIAQMQTNRVGASQYARPPTWYTGTSPVSVDTATFPAGSAMLHQNFLDLANAISYDVRTNGQVVQNTAAVAAGGDARTTPTAACGVPANQSVTAAATTLDTLISQNKGTPCVFGQAVVTDANGAVTFSSLDPNEWWGQSTLSIGIVGAAAIGVIPRTAYYTDSADLRVAFAGPGANATTYYSCKRRWTDGSPRNCTAIGTGTYNIATLGDARTMTFAGVPAQAAGVGYDRVYVERGDKVYYGFRTKLGSGYTIRLNAVAGNALLTKLNIPTITP